MAAWLGHDVYTVSYMGWCGQKNGDLLALIEAERFDAFITLDGGLPDQQDWSVCHAR